MAEGPQSLYPVAPPYYRDEWVRDIWPDLRRGHIQLQTPRVGVNAKTGAIMIGWPHVEQSVGKIFSTRFHERIMRQWVGSFIPHLIGELAIPAVITRFFWAVASALDLWEPCYKILRVRVLRRRGGIEVDDLSSAEELRMGTLTTAPEGIFMPRGHLGDFTPEQRRAIGLVDRGAGQFQAVQI
jgi:uncharacterized protein